MTSNWLEKPNVFRAAKLGAFWLAVALSIPAFGTSELFGKILGGNFGQAELNLIFAAAKEGAPLAIALGFTLLGGLSLLGLLMIETWEKLESLVGTLLAGIGLPSVATLGIALLGLRSDLNVEQIWNATRASVGPFSLPQTHSFVEQTRSFVEHSGAFLYQFELAFWSKYSSADYWAALAFLAYFCWILLVIVYRKLVLISEKEHGVSQVSSASNSKRSPDGMK